ncbi:MAG: hypothetical protein R3C28_26590 [Pirellulaceae bacterium]
MDRLVQDGQLDDPLLLLISELKARSLQRYSVTVNLASLFTCRTALTDGQFDPDSVRTKFSGRLANARRFASIARDLGVAVLQSPGYRNLCYSLRHDCLKITTHR